MEAFPEVKGFSISNFKYIRQWYLFYNQQSIIGQQAVCQLPDESLPPQLQDAIGQQAVAQLPDWRIEQMFKIPWGHHIAIISKCKTVPEGAYYTTNTINHVWSRTVLVHQIESDLYHREGKAISDFSQTLPSPQSDLAQQTFKLKKTDFEPEHVGKLNFYIKAIDEQYRQKGDEPTIGLLLCKSKDKVVAEYALSDINKPIGISSYRLTNILPEELKSSLPTIEEIEAEFRELKQTKSKRPKR